MRGDNMTPTAPAQRSGVLLGTGNELRWCAETHAVAVAAALAVAVTTRLARFEAPRPLGDI
jgi:hypothetical protein